MSQEQEKSRKPSDVELPLDASELSIEELETTSGGAAAANAGTNSVCQGPGVNTKLCTVVGP